MASGKEGIAHNARELARNEDVHGVTITVGTGRIGTRLGAVGFSQPDPIPITATIRASPQPRDRRIGANGPYI